MSDILTDLDALNDELNACLARLGKCSPAIADYFYTYNTELKTMINKARAGHYDGKKPASADACDDYLG